MRTRLAVEDVHDDIAVVENDPLPPSQAMNPPWTFIEGFSSGLFYSSRECFHLGSAGGRRHNERGGNGVRQRTQIQRDNVLSFQGFQAMNYGLRQSFCRGRCD